MAESTWLTRSRSGYKFSFLLGSDRDAGFDEFIDVEIEEPSGQRWSGTVGTLEAIRRRLEHYQKSGECSSGAYFWTADLLVLRVNDVESAVDALDDLVQTGKVEACFERIGPALSELRSLVSDLDWALDDGSRSGVNHYLDHGEPEMAFEILGLHLITNSIEVDRRTAEAIMDLGSRLSLDIESVYDPTFWDRLVLWAK